MPYTPNITLDADTEERLISYLDSELSNHYMERGSHLDDLMRWQEDYWAEPNTDIATEPFKGASTIIIPLTAIAVEAIHSRTMTTLFGFPQFVSTKAISGEWTQYAKPLENFLDKELLYNTKIYGALNNICLELIKFGTGIAKVGYEKVVKYAIREQNGVEVEFPVTVKNGAVVDAVSNSRFLMPFSSQDAQEAEWVGDEHSATPYMIQVMEDSGLFYEGTFEKLKAYFSELQTAGGQSGAEFTRNQEELENKAPVWPNRINWVEIQLSFDVNQSKRRREIIVHYHQDSGLLMSIRNNWHGDLRRSYRHGVYFPVEHRWNGVGVCKQNEQFQLEVTAQHRQRLDSGSIANNNMLIISNLSGYGPDEPIFPGKMWFVDDMTHVQPIKMGEINNSSFALESSVMLLSQMRTGVNETNLGMPQAGTPGTATSDIARIQEGKAKFDFVYKNIKDLTSHIITDAAVCIQQFGPRDVRYFETAENGQKVLEFFSNPESDIRNGLLIELFAAGQDKNKVIDRQNWVNIAAMLQQYYVGILEIAMQMQDPNIVGAIGQQALIASTEAARQMLESYDVRNIDKLIVKQLENLGVQNAAAQTGAGQLPNGNGNNGASKIIQGSGMGNFENLIRTGAGESRRGTPI